jgi:4-amino-4-deoxy-L-arabinose transferase-like glycosyltransferase
VERPSSRLLAAYIAASLILVYLSLFAILVVAAHAVSVAFLPRPVPRRPLLVAQAVVATLLAPLALWLLARGGRQASGTPDFTLTIVGRAGLDITGSCSVGCADESPPLNAYPLFLVFVLCVGVGALAAWRGWRSSPGSLRGWMQLLAVIWLVLPPLAAFIVSWAKPFFLATYLIGILPALAILTGVGITAMARRSVVLAVAAAGTLVALSLVEIVQYHRAPYKGDDLRAAAEMVVERAERGDAIGYAPAWSRIGFRYYLEAGRGAEKLPDDIALSPGGLPEEVGDLWARELDPATVSRRLAEHRRVWIVGYPGSTWHPTPEPILGAEQSVLARDYRRVSSRTFGEITVSLYERG